MECLGELGVRSCYQAKAHSPVTLSITSEGPTGVLQLKGYPEDAPKNSKGSHSSGKPPSTGKRMCWCSVLAAPWDGGVKSTHPDWDPLF